MIRLTINGKTWKGHILISSYRSLAKGPAIRFDPMIAVLTTNIEGLESDELALDTNNCGDAFIPQLVSQGIITSPHRTLNSGYCTYPVAKLK
jgi:hypothetical protein